MTTPVQMCSSRVYHRISSNWGERQPCTRKATVTRDLLPYCTTHDPVRREARYTSKCYHRDPYGSLCGEPGVAVQYGSGRCARHTQEALDAAQRLQQAAPALLEALEAADEWSLNLHSHDLDSPCPNDCVAQQVVAAIAKATGKE